MKKSRFLCFLMTLILVLAMAFTACGGGGGDDETSPSRNRVSRNPVSSSKPSENVSSNVSSSKTSSNAVVSSSEEVSVNTSVESNSEQSASNSVESVESVQPQPSESSSSSSSSAAPVVSVSSAGGGGRPGATKTRIDFWGNGDDNEKAVFTQLTNDFNSTIGAANNVQVVYTHQSDLGGAISNRLGSSQAPDVFYVGDGEYKKYVEAGYIEDLTSRINNSSIIDTNDMWPSIYDRYFYDKNTHRGGDDATNGAWYALPKDIGPTVLYYNEDMLNQCGVTVISVAPENLAAYNNGAADDRGKTKAQAGITSQVKEKGYFEVDGAKFFNNQVAMNWDEVRTLATLINTTLSSSSKTVYGYHTEWWFAYGWSVGGDCIQYVDATGTDDDGVYDGNGFYDFTLVDDTTNFIVADSQTNGVTVNGNHYDAGEIISYQDKLLNEYDLAGQTEKHDMAEYDYDLLDLVAEGKVNELPSQREAFVEFVLLSTSKTVQIDGKYGYEACPNPSSLGSDAAKTENFTSQNLAMLVDGRWNVTNFRNTDVVSFNWDVAPLPVYKQYDSNGNITVHGVESGHSGSVGLAVNAHSSATEKNGAWLFVEYLGGPVGQTAQSLTGFAIPSQMSIASATNNGPNGGGVFVNQKDGNGNLLKPYNAKIFVRAAMNEHEGDWAYLKTGSAWIDAWAGSLNGPVRNGQMAFEDFLADKTFTDTYTMLKAISLS